MKNLFTIEDCYKFDISKINDLYNQYVNPGQVNLINTFSFGEDIIKEARGCWLYTENKKILDMTGGKGVLNHGHNHPEILKARILFQNENRPEVHKTHLSPFLAALSSNIANLLPASLNKSYFVNSGSEAVDGALKMAYKYHEGKRSCVLHSDISFHGKLIGSGSVTASEEIGFRFQEIPSTHSFKYGDIESVRMLIDQLKDSRGNSDVYAVIVEPFSAGSLEQCSKDFLINLRELCNLHNIVLIFDEVYTGWCKTGHLFYFMRYQNLVPDILTYSKSFGGGKSSISGYSCTDIIFKRTYSNLKDAILHSTTYNGFGEETITAICAINILVKDNYNLKAQEIEKQILERTKRLSELYPIIGSIKGAGAHYGLNIHYHEELLLFLKDNLPKPLASKTRTLKKIITASIIEELYTSHDILASFGSNRGIPLLITPSLIISQEELNYFFDSLEEVLSIGLPKLVKKLVYHKFKTIF